MQTVYFSLIIAQAKSVSTNPGKKRDYGDMRQEEEKILSMKFPHIACHILYPVI